MHKVDCDSWLLLLPHCRAKLEEKRKKEEEKRMKEEEKRLKEEKDVSSAAVMPFYCASAAATSLAMCVFSAYQSGEGRNYTVSAKV